jgi:cytochrome c551/c552
MHSQKANKSCLLAIIGASVILSIGACTKNSGAPASATDSGTTSAPATNGGNAKGIGPVTEVKLAALDSGLATKGKGVFEAKCTACHKIDERYVGPALRGVTKRRAPEWVMNMILNPGEMTQKDETAKGLLGEYLTQMTFQNVTQDEVRSILEFFRENDK